MWSPRRQLDVPALDSILILTYLVIASFSNTRLVEEKLFRQGDATT